MFKKTVIRYAHFDGNQFLKDTRAMCLHKSWNIFTAQKSPMVSRQVLQGHWTGIQNTLNAPHYLQWRCQILHLQCTDPWARIIEVRLGCDKSGHYRTSLTTECVISPTLISCLICLQNHHVGYSEVQDFQFSLVSSMSTRNSKLLCTLRELNSYKV